MAIVMDDLDMFYGICLLIPLSIAVILAGLYRQRSASIYFTILWNLFLTMLLVSVFFGVAETYYRFFQDTTDSFGLNKLTKRWIDRHYRLNNLNARDHIDYPHKRIPGKRRFSFLGDSFTVGHGIEQVDDRFVNLIREKLPGIEAHAMAKSGLETDAAFEILQKLHHYDGYEFDIIVLVYNLNDIAYRMPETYELYDRLQAYQQNLNVLDRNSYFLNTWYFRYLGLQDPDILNYYQYVKSAYTGEQWAGHVALMTDMVQFIRQQGWQLMVVTFPLLHNIGSGYEFRDVHRQLDDYWKHAGIPHLDLLSVYEQHSAASLVLHKYDAHPNQRAHAIAADAIGDFIRNPLQERSSDE